MISQYDIVRPKGLFLPYIPKVKVYGLFFILNAHELETSHYSRKSGNEYLETPSRNTGANSISYLKQDQSWDILVDTNMARKSKGILCYIAGNVDNQTLIHFTCFLSHNRLKTPFWKICSAPTEEWTRGKQMTQKLSSTTSSEPAWTSLTFVYSSLGFPTALRQPLSSESQSKIRLQAFNDDHPLALTSIFIKCFERLVMAHIHCSLQESLEPQQSTHCWNRFMADDISLALHSTRYFELPLHLLSHIPNVLMYGIICLVACKHNFSTVCLCICQ